MNTLFSVCVEQARGECTVSGELRTHATSVILVHASHCSNSISSC